jgi:hypothetical protein
MSFKQRNLIYALQMGFINWFQFLEQWRQLDEDETA